MPLATEGGSTLATQIEKLRHSPGGRTSSPLDKLRQVTAASLKAYRSGPDTRAYRRDIVVDYLNSMPLAALPDRGEVRGLGEGLQAWFGLDFADVQRSLLDRGDLGAEGRRVQGCARPALRRARADATPGAGSRRARAAAQRLHTAARRGGCAEPRARGTRGDRHRCDSGHHSRADGPDPRAEQKAVAAVRTELLDLLSMPGLYDLDRLDVEVDSTIDVPLQSAVRRLLTDLRDPAFIAQPRAHGQAPLVAGKSGRRHLHGPALRGDASRQTCCACTPIRSISPSTSTLGMKMGLGSTAKLAHAGSLPRGRRRSFMRS